MIRPGLRVHRGLLLLVACLIAFSTTICGQTFAIHGRTFHQNNSLAKFSAEIYNGNIIGVQSAPDLVVNNVASPIFEVVASEDGSVQCVTFKNTITDIQKANNRSNGYCLFRPSGVAQAFNGADTTVV